MLSFEWNFLGLSSETKPVAGEKVIDGSTFYECDTGNFYIFYDGTWYKQTFITEDGINVYVYKYLMRKMFKRSFDSNISKLHIYRPDVGSNISFTSEYPASITDMQVYGDTFQQTYSGKNLIDNTNLTYTYATNTDRFTLSTINTGIEVTATSGVSVQPIILFKSVDLTSYTGKTVRMKGTFNGGEIRIGRMDNTGGNRAGVVIGSTSDTEISFVVPDELGTSPYLFYGVRLPDTDSQLVSSFTNLVLTIDNADMSYEPYVGGTASPNPSYPQDVQVVTGEQTVAVKNKNLFNKDAAPQGGYFATYSALSTGVRATATNAINYSYIRYVFNVEGYVGQTITMSAIATPSASNKPALAIGTCNSAGTNRVSKDVQAGSGSISVSYTIEAGVQYIYISIYSNQVGTASIGDYADYTNAQLEISASPTSYQPYQSQSYTVDLGSTELCRIGDYQDYIYKSGDDWYVHKEIGKVVLDGSQGLSLRNTSSNNTYTYSMDTPFDYKVESGAIVISDHFIYLGTVAGVGAMYNSQYYLDKLGVALYYNSGSPSTQSVYINSNVQLPTWLSTHNTKVYYALATPTDTKITDNTLIGQLEDILTYEFPTGTNNIIVTASDLPALLKLTITERD